MPTPPAALPASPDPGGAAARRGAPARVLTVRALAPSLDAAHEVLTGRRCTHRRTGATGARVYEFGSRLGDLVLGGGGARLLLPPALRRHALHGWLVVHPMSTEPPTLTVAAPRFDPAAGVWAATAIDAVVAELDRRRLLTDAGAELSSLALPDSPAFPRRFRTHHGD